MDGLQVRETEVRMTERMSSVVPRDSLYFHKSCECLRLSNTSLRKKECLMKRAQPRKYKTVIESRVWPKNRLFLLHFKSVYDKEISK